MQDSSIPTEPIGSIPRPLTLIDALARTDSQDPSLTPLYDDAVREDRRRLGVHTCPGGDRDSTHSADVDYAELPPSLFELKVGSFFVALAGESDPQRVLKIARRYLKPDQRLFVGVVAPIDPRIETAEQVRDRVLEAARHIPVEQLGTTDDCGFSPFCDDISTSRDAAFEKITARVVGTALAARILAGTP